MTSTHLMLVPAAPLSPTTTARRLEPLSTSIKQVIRGEREPSDLEETREVLLELGRRKSGKFPAELLVDQVLAITEGTDWPSRRAATT